MLVVAPENTPDDQASSRRQNLRGRAGWQAASGRQRKIAKNVRQQKVADKRRRRAPRRYAPAAPAGFCRCGTTVGLQGPRMRPHKAQKTAPRWRESANLNPSGYARQFRRALIELPVVTR